MGCGDSLACVVYCAALLRFSSFITKILYCLPYRVAAGSSVPALIVQPDDCNILQRPDRPLHASCGLAVMHSYTAIIIYSASFAYNQQYVCLYSAGLNDYAAD